MVVVVMVGGGAGRRGYCDGGGYGGHCAYFGGYCGGHYGDCGIVVVVVAADSIVFVCFTPQTRLS